MTKETLQTLRNILLRTLLVSLAFAVLTATVYYTGRSHWDRMMVDRWQLIDQLSLNLVIVGFYADSFLPSLTSPRASGRLALDTEAACLTTDL
jgi:hypothetical protein